MMDETRVAESKYDLGKDVPVIDTSDLPWSYGENRVTAIVRDPDSAYLYWEVTNEALAAAGARLGPTGAEGWCNLRVYDTTARQFDGTNANDYFDIRVERNDREYFLMIRRPTSTMHVEIGIKTHDGYFQPIARSGAATFPRSDPSPNTALEWMTVTSDDAPPAAGPCRSRYSGPEPALPARAGGGYVDVWRAAYAPSMPHQADDATREHASWSGATVHRHRSVHIERWWHLDEWRAEWRGGLRFMRSIGAAGEQKTMTWHEGPFPVELFDAERIAIELLGESSVHLHSEEGTEFTVFGPWRVVIRSFEAEPGRRVLSTWSVRWVRATTPMIERWGHVLERQLIDDYEREYVTLGASERQVLLERGASERWRLGGSERVWIGASESAAAGGSETFFIGGSQVGWAGASALLYRGASERIGASERWLIGASERVRLGASEWTGASEHASANPLGGGSEQSTMVGERWGGRL